MNTTYLFVYGTLRRDANSEMFHLLARYADFVGYSTYQGTLYKIDYYPGVVPSKHRADLVQGETYQLHEPDFVLSRLDEYEECGTGFQKPTEYVREIQNVRLQNGETIQAWVYIYNRPTDNLELVQSGDFLTIQPEKGGHQNKKTCPPA